jgi:hypothetical protein
MYFTITYPDMSVSLIDRKKESYFKKGDEIEEIMKHPSLK